jgi:hypothetical protein
MAHIDIVYVIDHVILIEARIGAAQQRGRSIQPLPLASSVRGTVAKGQHCKAKLGMENSSNFTTPPTVSGNCDPFLDDKKCVSY